MPKEHDFDRLDHSWKIYQNNQELIRFADQKINTLLIITGVISAIVFANLDALKSLNLGVIIFFSIFIIGFLVSLIFSLKVILSRSDKYSKEKLAKLHYFNHIVDKRSASKYAQDLKNADIEEIQKDLSFQIFETASITSKKFQSYQNALILVGVQLIGFIGFMIFISLQTNI